MLRGPQFGNHCWKRESIVCRQKRLSQAPDGQSDESNQSRIRTMCELKPSDSFALEIMGETMHRHDNRQPAQNARALPKMRKIH